jgi:hypothetical protein
MVIVFANNLKIVYWKYLNVNKVLIKIDVSGTSRILLYGIIQRRLFFIRRRKLSERESRERNSVWKGRFTSADRLVGEKEGSSPCGNSLPLFTVIRSTAGGAYRSPSTAIECIVADAFLESAIYHISRISSFSLFRHPREGRNRIWRKTRVSLIAIMVQLQLHRD